MKLAFSVAEVSEITGIARTRLYEEISSGRLIIAKIGRRTVVRLERLDEWLRSSEATRSPSSPSATTMPDPILQSPYTPPSAGVGQRPAIGQADPAPAPRDRQPLTGPRDHKNRPLNSSIRDAVDTVEPPALREF